MPALLRRVNQRPHGLRYGQGRIRGRWEDKIAAGPGLAFDNPSSLTVQVDFPRPRLAVDKVESIGANLAPPERPDLAATASGVVEEADDVGLRRPFRPFVKPAGPARHEGDWPRRGTGTG